jgi:organic hydroperoxide reductase OsmC/OhrA
LYVAGAAGQPSGSVTVTSPRLPDLTTAPPAEFDGPGDLWSPETLFCAAIADCYILTFRAIARASGLEWSSLSCKVEGVLDRVDRVTRFTAIRTHATLEVPGSGDHAKARSLLEKSEHACLVTNSLNGKRTLIAEVVTAG